MKLKYSCFLIYLLSTFFLTNNVFADGNQLLESCLHAERFANGQDITTEDLSRAMSCFSYLQGVGDTWKYGRILQKQFKPPCTPESGIINEQAMRITLKYLRAHPELLHKHEIVLVWSAFNEAFPCD